MGVVSKHFLTYPYSPLAQQLKISKLNHHPSLINSAQLLVDNTNVEQYVLDPKVILLIRDHSFIS